MLYFSCWNYIEILFELFFILTEYCPISNSNVNAIITDMNNIESSIDSDSRNKVNNINNNRNNIVNYSRISDSENRNINIRVKIVVLLLIM
jgi:hypothetical protein